MGNMHDCGNNNSGLFGVIHGLSFGIRSVFSGIKATYEDERSKYTTQDMIIPGVYQDRNGYFRDKKTSQWVYYDPTTNMLYNRHGHCVRNLEVEDWELRWATLKQAFNRNDLISALPSEKEFVDFPGRYYIDINTNKKLIPRRVRVSDKTIWEYEKQSSYTPEYNIPGDWIDYYVDKETGLLVRETDQHIYYRFAQRYESDVDIYTNEYIQKSMEIINELIKRNEINVWTDFNVDANDAKTYYENHKNDLFAITVNYKHNPKSENELRNWYDEDYVHRLKYYKQWNKRTRHLWISNSGGFKSNVGYSNWDELAEKYRIYKRIHRDFADGYMYNRL